MQAALDTTREHANRRSEFDLPSFDRLSDGQKIVVWNYSVDIHASLPSFDASLVLRAMDHEAQIATRYHQRSMPLLSVQADVDKQILEARCDRVISQLMSIFGECQWLHACGVAVRTQVTCSQCAFQAQVVNEITHIPGGAKLVSGIYSSSLAAADQDQVQELLDRQNQSREGGQHANCLQVCYNLEHVFQTREVFIVMGVSWSTALNEGRAVLPVRVQCSGRWY